MASHENVNVCRSWSRSFGTPKYLTSIDDGSRFFRVVVAASFFSLKPSSDSTGIMVSAVMDRVHMSAPMIPNMLLYDLNREARSMLSVAWANKGNGFSRGGGWALSPDFEDSSAAAAVASLRLASAAALLSLDAFPFPVAWFLFARSLLPTAGFRLRELRLVNVREYKPIHCEAQSWCM